MAGELSIKGWIGGAGDYYRETRAPRLRYSPVEVADGFEHVFQKELVRQFKCMTANLESAITALSVDDPGVITVAVVSDAAGGTSSVSYGGGWKLASLDTPPIDEVFTEINVVYRKIQPSVLFTLPSGLTLVEEDGVSTWKYNDTAVESYDSGRGVTQHGLEIRVIDAEFHMGVNPSRKQIPYWQVRAQVGLYCENVLMEHLEVSAADVASEESVGGGWYELSAFAHVHPYLEWDTTQANHIKLLLYGIVWKDWDITGL